MANTPIGESDAFQWLIRYTNRIGGKYIKAIFNEYDSSFTTQLPKPAWSGNLGPIIKANVGDVIEFRFKNNCSFPYGVHSHGVHFDKKSEGAEYSEFKGISGAAIEPGEEYTYVWSVPERSGPS
jgi:hypothetical protein